MKNKKTAPVQKITITKVFGEDLPSKKVIVHEPNKNDTKKKK